MSVTARRLDALQVLRAIAAIGVVVGHLAQFEARYLPDPILGPGWMMGFAGVDLFFVISGFVMVHVTTGNQRSSGTEIGRFLFARATRIYPIYWVFTLIALAGVLAIPGLEQESVDFGAFLKSLLLVPDWTQPFLPVGWTLIHELYFYVIFALFLLAPRRLLPVMLLAWLGLTMTGFFSGLNHGGPVLHLLVHPLTAEFVLGCLIGLYGQRGGRLAGFAALAVGAVVFSLFTWVIAPQSIADLPDNWVRVGVQGLPATFIVYGAIALERSGQSFSRMAIAVGDWSYSLYLGHALVLVGGITLWVRIVPDIGPWDNVAMLTGGFAASLVAAALSYRWIENPALRYFRHLRDQLFQRR